MNNFSRHLIKEITIIRYGNDKQLITTFSPYEIYQYSHSMLKHLPKGFLKKFEKTMLYSKKPVYFNKTTIDRRMSNGSGGGKATSKANDAKDLNIDERITNSTYLFKTDISVYNFQRPRSR